jgi:hypothetical protein
MITYIEKYSARPVICLCYFDVKASYRPFGLATAKFVEFDAKASYRPFSLMTVRGTTIAPFSLILASHQLKFE